MQLNALRHADFLAQMTYEAERRATKAKAGRPSKTRLQSDGALLVMDARARLGPNLVPVSKVVNEKVNHVAFDDVHVEATGAVYYRIWAAPRARSICGHLEVKVQRGVVVSFWKPVCCSVLYLLNGVEGPPLLDRITQTLRRTPSTRYTPGFPHTGLYLLAVSVRDHRGDAAPEVGFTVATSEAVEALAGDGGSIGDTFSLVLGGGKRHDLRVGDLGRL